MSKHFGIGIVTPKGILVNHLFYSCSTAIKKSWFLQSYEIGVWRILVIYDTEFPESIYVINETEIISANLLATASDVPHDIMQKYYAQLDLLKTAYKSIRRKRKKFIKRRFDHIN